MACIRTEEPQWEAGSAPHSTPNKSGQKNIIQIYTDWANHYLDKGKCKRHIQSLQNDVVDGVIISDVIEAVTGQKVADVNRRPKTRAQMVQNLDLCLAHLRSLGVAIDDVHSDDVIDGKLKPILGLFFQLSRHKQQQQQNRKPRTAESPAQHTPSKVPGGTKSGISCIPSARDRQSVDNKTKQSLLQKPSSAASSRSTSPTSISGSRSRLASGQRSGLSTPRMGRAATAKTTSSLAGPAVKTPQTKSTAVSSAGPAAAKDKSRSSRTGGNVIKRTSSSSGFSSARSEKSDSSSNVNTAETSSTGVPEPVSRTGAADNCGSLPRRAGQRSLLQAPQQRGARGPATSAAAAAAAKRRSLAGSQSSLASSCGGGPTGGSSIPKPTSAASMGGSTASASPALPAAVRTASPAPTASSVPAAASSAVSAPSPAAPTTAPNASPAPATAASTTTPATPAAPVSAPSEEKALVQLPRQRQLGRGRPAPAVSVALVSPMPQTPDLERSGSGGHPAARGTADQAGRRTSQESSIPEPVSDVKPDVPEKTPDPESAEDVYSLRPMQPILRLSQYGFSRGGMSLAGRRQHNQHSYGYMSDTDGVGEDPRYDSVMDGYMSEDGLYARSHGQVKYSSGGEETSLWRVETPQKPPGMASDRSAYYSYTDAPGSQYIKKPTHAPDQNRFTKKDQTPEFKQISNTQWKRAVEGRRPTGEHQHHQHQHHQPHQQHQQTQMGAPGSPAVDPRHGRDQRGERERSQTPSGKHKRENGTSTPEPAASPAVSAAAESPNLKFSRQKLRKSAASYTKRPTSQTSVSSAGSAAGLPPKDPEHRPRTKVKVSGSTQTTADLGGGGSEHDQLTAQQQQQQQQQQRRLQQLKSYSLTGPAAQQLSQSVRERILAGGGVTGAGGEQSFSTLPAAGQRPRPAKMSDGSLSDSNYSPYGDPRRHPAQRPSSAYTTYVGQQLAKTFRGSMTEAESMESVSSGASGLLAQLQQQRSGSLTQNRLISYGQQWDASQGAPSPRLSRSNSIRSTKSEKLYSNLLQRGGSADDEPYYQALAAAGRAEPPSPTPSPSRASFPLSPGAARGNYGQRASKDDDAHGSSLSLVSTTSSIYSAQEEKQASEYRRLKRDLAESQEKVQTLTNQLTTNAHVVEAFEQSLTSMTKKLHQITLSSEQKDKDMMEMRKQIERLQRALSSSGGGTLATPLTRQTSNESISSMSSACSAHSQQSGRTPDSPGSKKKKKKGWFSASPQLRSSFGKAFSRRKPKTGSDMEDGSAPSSPVMASRHGASPAAGAESNDSTPSRDAGLPPSGPLEEDLRRQLREKDTALTDMRLEALSSHHQLETLKETVNRVRKEMACMRQDNERLQRLVASRSANSSRSSLTADPAERPPAVPSPSGEAPPSRLSDASGAAEQQKAAPKDSKVLTLGVRLGGEDCAIGTVTVARKTGWEALDDAIRGAFKDYLCRLDPDQSLGIDSDSITGYRLGEVWRGLAANDDPPELMPWGYTIGDVRQAQLELRGHEAGCVDAFVFETLIPKPIVHRYVSILVEHRRVILCGQAGTGKTYLARRLAEYLVRRSGAEPSPQTVATVTVEPGGGRELHQYLGQLSERCRRPDAALPHCLILDNLHHVQALADVFTGFLSTAHTDPRCPYIIGTLSQPAGASTELQLHHNFRWVLCANHVEPVRGFLGRHLRRRLAGAELATGTHDPQLRAVFEWVPRVWQQLNKFLETHSSADVTMGPRLLLNCPCDLTASQVWFTGVWNYSIVPYLVETVREGLLIYGRRASWHDPTQFVLDTYPWPRAAPHAGADSLTRLRPEDVGYEAAAAAAGSAGSGTSGQGGGGSSQQQQSQQEGSRRALRDADPLLSMLMSLQEAANYSPLSGRPSSAATTPDRPHEPPGGRRTAGQATL